MRLFLLGLLATVVAGRSYDGYHVVEAFPKEAGQIMLMKSLTHDTQLEFWDDKPMLPDRRVEFMFPPNRMDIYNRLDELQVDYNVLSTDLERDIEDTKIRAAERMDYDPNEYNTYDDILSHLDFLLVNCPDSFSCSIDSIGQSIEGRDILMFRFAPQGPTRGSVYIDSSTHSREWLSVTSVMNMLDRIWDGSGGDTEMRDNYVWYFVPVVNPDGYIYTWTNDRMWRKNRRNNAGTSCMGVDLNRNFEADWNTGGSSSIACSDTYMGPSAASEPETQAIQDIAMELREDLVAFISVHCHGEMWLHSYGSPDPPNSSSCKVSEHDTTINAAAQRMCAASQSSDPGTSSPWSCGSVCETIYVASGGTVDYAHTIGIVHSYTPELRGPGFNPPPSHIQPGFEEFWDAIDALLDFIEHGE